MLMRTRGTVALGAAAALVTFAGAAAPAEAQINVETFAQVGFNFSAPGARSAGLGGAFIALADDATAAETNPAGLTTLLRPELSFEFKGIRYSRTVEQRAGGSDFENEFTSDVAVPSFASLVLPVGGFTLGAFRHELVNYASRTFAVGNSFTDDGLGYYLFPYTTDMEMRIVNYGGALALRAGAFSIGVAGGASILDMELQYLRYQLPVFEPGMLVNQVVVEPEDGSATGYFVNGGVLIRPNERFSIGAVYRLRPKFEDLRLQSLDRVGVPFSSTPDTLFQIRVPDALGAGLAFRAHDLVTVSLAAVLQRYSQLAEEMAFTYDEADGDVLIADDFVADDGIDYHGGVEIIVPIGLNYVVVRGGAFMLAPSNIYYEGPSRGSERLWGDEPGDNQIGVAAGFGTQLFGRLQVDAAGTWSEDRLEAIVSAGLRFGRL